MLVNVRRRINGEEIAEGAASGGEKRISRRARSRTLRPPAPRNTRFGDAVSETVSLRRGQSLRTRMDQGGIELQ